MQNPYTKICINCGENYDSEIMGYRLGSKVFCCRHCYLAWIEDFSDYYGEDD
jgi:hypothetical protein